MTKLVRKLKQMAKKRSHRKAVQKRKADRIQRDLEREKESEQAHLEAETDMEMARLISNDEGAHSEGSSGRPEKAASKHQIRVIGGLVLDAPMTKRKQLTRRQAKRKEKAKVRGEAIAEMITKKWEHKKRRVKQRAHIRNEDLQ